MAKEGQVVNQPGSGLDENVAGALAYFFGFVTGILFLIIEPKNKFVKFHALQSIAVSLVLSVFLFPLSFFAAILPGILGLMVSCLLCIVGLVILLLWLFLMYQAYEGNRFKLPIIGDFAERESQK